MTCHWKNWTSSTVWKFYFQNVSRVFLEYFHTMEIGFSIFFYNIPKICPYYGKTSIFPEWFFFRICFTFFCACLYFTEKQSFKSFGAVLCNEEVNWYWFALMYVCNILYILNTNWENYNTSMVLRRNSVTSALAIDSFLCVMWSSLFWVAHFSNEDQLNSFLLLYRERRSNT